MNGFQYKPVITLLRFSTQGQVPEIRLFMMVCIVPPLQNVIHISTVCFLYSYVCVWSDNSIAHQHSRLVVLESGLESIFAGLGLGLGLELKGLGLGLGLATYGLGLGLGLGSFFSKSFFKSTLQSAPVERVFIYGGIVNFAISHSSTVICCTWE